MYRWLRFGTFLGRLKAPTCSVLVRTRSWWYSITTVKSVTALVSYGVVFVPVVVNKQDRAFETRYVISEQAPPAFACATAAAHCVTEYVSCCYWYISIVFVLRSIEIR